jgi:hypothetical protein
VCTSNNIICRWVIIILSYYYSFFFLYNICYSGPQPPPPPGHGFFPFRFSLRLPSLSDHIALRAQQRAERFVYYGDSDRSRPAAAVIVPATRGVRVGSRVVDPSAARRSIIVHAAPQRIIFVFLVQIYSDVSPAVCAHGRWCAEQLSGGFYWPPAADGMFLCRRRREP